MPLEDPDEFRKPRATISLCPERIPYFGYESQADRRLAETIRTLDRNLMQDRTRPRETSVEALTRHGFLRGER